MITSIFPKCVAPTTPSPPAIVTAPDVELVEAVRPPILRLPPMFAFNPTPRPPAATIAPVELEVEFVVPKAVKFYTVDIEPYAAIV